MQESILKIFQFIPEILYTFYYSIILTFNKLMLIDAHIYNNEVERQWLIAIVFVLFQLLKNESNFFLQYQ